MRFFTKGPSEKVPTPRPAKIRNDASPIICMNEVIKRHIGHDVDVFYFLGEAEGRFFRGRKLRKLYC